MYCSQCYSGASSLVSYPGLAGHSGHITATSEKWRARKSGVKSRSSKKRRGSNSKVAMPCHLALGKGCNTPLMSASFSNAHFDTFVHASSFLEICPLQFAYIMHLACMRLTLGMWTPRVGLLFQFLGPRTITQSSAPYNNRNILSQTMLPCNTQPVYKHSAFKTPHILIYLTLINSLQSCKWSQKKEHLLRHTSFESISLIFGTLSCNWKFPFNCMTESFSHEGKRD